MDIRTALQIIKATPNTVINRTGIGEFDVLFYDGRPYCVAIEKSPSVLTEYTCNRCYHEWVTADTEEHCSRCGSEDKGSDYCGGIF